MNNSKHFIQLVLALGVLTFSVGSVYFVAQQMLRQGANDPQIQMAHDVATALNSGKAPASLEIGEKINIAESLAPFVIIYDVNGNPLATTGILHGDAPKLPQGVLQYSAKAGEDRVTWQPERGVRIALVAVPYKNGYAAVGRSLREVEVREFDLLGLICLVWAAGAAATFCLFWFMRRFLNPAN